MTLSRHRFSLLGLALTLPLCVGACSSAPGPEPVTPADKLLDWSLAPKAWDETPMPGLDTNPDDADRITQSVVELAMAAIGTPYEWGGTDGNGFDCSGLVQYAYGRHGIRLPRVSRAQMESGSRIDLDAKLFRPGDILGFSTNDPNKTSHVGLYIGDDDFIHSSSTGVRISNLDNPYWQEHLVAARRIVE